MERFPYPTCASNTRHQNSNCVTWTWNWRRAITDRVRWPRRLPRASRSMGVRKTHRACAEFSTNAKSPREFSRYEYLPCPSQRSPSSRLHRSGGPLSLHCGDPLRLLCCTAIPHVHWHPLGPAHGQLLGQATHQETREDRALSKERNGLSSVLPPSLPPDRPREHPQPSATRTRIHPSAHRNARLCPLEPAVEVPGNRAGKSQLFLRSAESPDSLPSLEDLSRAENFPAHRSLLRR